MKEKKVVDQIQTYRRKYYINQLIRGGLLSALFLITCYTLFTTVEYFVRMGSLGRGVLFFGFIGISAFLLYRFIVRPINYLIQPSQGLSNEEAAVRIGSFFPGVADRLLNFLQLRNLSKGHQSALLNASLDQRAQSLEAISFAEAIDISENKKYIRYLAPVLLLVAGVVILAPQLFTAGTERIINYNKEFVPVAPFTFDVNTDELVAFRNEDHDMTLRLAGSGLPQHAYIIHRERRTKLTSLGGGLYTHTFTKIQSDKRIRFEAAGYKSSTYTVEVVNRPNLSNFNVELSFPRYLNLKSERLENVGNLSLPEGTSVKWQFKTLDTQALGIAFGEEEAFNVQSPGDQLFEHQKSFNESTNYRLLLQNSYAENKDVIAYRINVIPDQFPAINLNVYQDTVLYSFLVLGGNITDDYGLTNLKLNYRILDENNRSRSDGWISIPFNRQQVSQSYYYNWSLDSLDLEEGWKLEYFVKVWDNDGINGIKGSTSGTYTFKIPTKEEVKDEIAKSSAKTSEEMEGAMKEARELKETLEQLENKLRGKTKLNWQDEKMLQELMQQKEELNQAIEEMKRQFEAEKQKRQRFQNQSEQIQEKVEDIQQLLEEILDEETRALYEELQKLLEEELDNDQIQEILDQINNKEEDLLKELERTLELFKKMKFDSKLEESIEKLDEIAEMQEQLSEETSDKQNDNQELSQKQEDIKEDFEDFKKDMEDLQELNQDLQNPQPMQDFSEENQQIQEKMEQSQQELGDNKRKKAAESQQQSSQQMRKMSQKLQQMQSSMEMQSMQANLNDLRDILHNLIKLSFDEEALMGEFRAVDQSDPRFVDLGQWQLKIKDDAAIVEDSLLSLANRAGQLGVFVTREVSGMNEHLDNSIESIRDRKKAKAVSEQQFAMTSMNNLALMLDDVMDQMQQNLSEAMGRPKKEGDQRMPSLSELQQQLNQQIEDLKRSGKSGRDLSEELAKLAAEQERIRKALQEMEGELDHNDKGRRNEISEKMEETEIDLVNKQITAETIQRQKEILTRLLEAENSKRERELDNKREGETAKEYENALPKAFEEYFKAKEKEVELLKTMPPKLYPYYKKEVNEYFKRIGNQNFE